MIYFTSFKNYDAFKNVFGLRECGNGNMARMNKILLGCLKNKAFFHYCVSNLPKMLEVRNMADFKVLLLNSISGSTANEAANSESDWYFWEFQIDGNTYHFHIEGLQPDNNGICYDGDTNAVRYFNAERKKFFKMKAGKFFTKIMDGCDFGKMLPQQAKSWLGEEFLTSWQSYAEAHSTDHAVEFHYGNEKKDFRRIYSSGMQRGNFHSCMTDEEFDDMYFYCAKCHAAWLTDEEGYMFARCIVWDEVLDETTGRTLRLAERQYSDSVQDRYKKMLVDELIKRRLIDGYKQIGASCHDNRAYVLVNGESISDHKLSIHLSIDADDHVSYMDSFVYYDREEERAYNYTPGHYDYELDTTDGYLPIVNRVHSDYHGDYIPEDEAVYVDSREDYFFEDECVCDVNNDWQFQEDCVQCDQCGQWVLEDDSYQIEDSDDDLSDYYFCDSECAEAWLENHDYVYCDYDEIYTQGEVYTVNVWRWNRWNEEDMTAQTFEDLDFEDEIHTLDGEYYLVNNEASREQYKNLTLPAVIA